MESYSNFIGVDISKNCLDLCSLSVENPKEMSFAKIENELNAINQFLKKLDAQKLFFCMEDTGIYGMRLYQALSEKGFKFSVIPAIQIKRSKGLQRGKSDKADARDIAFYALTHQHNLPLYQLPEVDLQELKMLLAEREKLTKAVKLFGSTAEATCYADKKACKALEKNNKKTLDFLKKQLAEAEKLIRELIKNNAHMKEQDELLRSIPGIGPQTAIQLISFTKCFTSFDNWRQLACYAGIAPFPYQSGTSIKGKTKVSHYAQKKLKSTIHMAALSSKKYDKQVKIYYERKVVEGKQKMSVLNAVSCKLIARAFAVINRGTPYVNTLKYAA